MKLPKPQLKGRISNLLLPGHLTKSRGLVFIAAFAVAGSILLFVTRAAGPFASLEPEQGTKTAQATVGSDTTASGGQFVQFGGTLPPTGSRCPAYPAFPDASCTGVPPGVTLTGYTGSMDVTIAGTVIDSKQINGCISINASNVTIKRSKIVSTCGAGAVVNFIPWYGLPEYGGPGPGQFTNLVLEDVEIDGVGAADDCVHYYNYTARRVNVHGCADGGKIGDNTLIEDSYYHDNALNIPGCHCDGLQATGGNGITIRHSTIVGPHHAGIILGDENSALANITIENNLLDGGNYTLYGGWNQVTQTRPANMRITGNRFRRNFTYGTHVYVHSDTIWSGNVFDDNGGPIGL